jgi:teichuronic acid exporter
MSLRSQALSGFRWTASVRMLSQLMTWTMTLVVIRLLAPADYGLLAMATVFVTFLAMFAELGLGAAVVQKAEVDQQLLKRTFGLVLILHLSLAALMNMAAPTIGVFYGEPRVVGVIRALSLQFVIAGFAVVPDAQLQRQMEFKNRSLLELTSAILASLTTLGLAYMGAGVWSLVVGSLLAQLYKTIGLNVLSPFVYWPDFSMQGMQSLLQFGRHFTAVQVLWLFLSQVDVLIAAKWLGNELLGFYSVAMHLASLPSQRLSGLVNQVAFPVFSRMQHDKGRVSDSVLLGTRVLSFFAFPVLWGISSVAAEIIALALGEKWAASALPLQILALIIPLRMLGNFIGTAIQGIGRSDILLKIVAGSALMTPTAFVIGVSVGELLGLCLAWLVLAPLVFLQSMVLSLPALNMGVRQVLRAILPAVLASAVMYGTVALARHVIDSGLDDSWRLLVLVVVGALAYGTASWLINRTGAREMLALLRGIATAKRTSNEPVQAC